MSRLRIIFFFLLCAFTANGINSLKQHAIQAGKPSPLITLKEGDKYADRWAKIDSLDKKGLPQSALIEVKEIYALAQKDQNGPQILKSMMYIMKYNSYLKEDDFIMALNDLNKMAEESVAPQKQMVHSMIAEVYWGYYQSNRYKFLNRTETVNFKNEDVRTWDLNTLSKHIIRHYLYSLDKPEITKTISVKSYEEVLNGYTTYRDLRPTLYDFLAHRAINFFKSTELDVTKPAYAFRIDKPEYFGNTSMFNEININTRDTFSTKFYALKAFQELSKFHSLDADPKALITLELERLAFVRQYSVVPQKDTSYYLALKVLKEKYKEHASSTEVDYELAKLHEEIGNLYNPVIGDESGYKWHKNTALRICAEALKAHPTAYGAQQCKQLQLSILSKILVANVEDVVIPNKASKLLLTSKNVDKVYIRIVKSGWDFNNREYYEETEDLVKKLLGMTPVRQWEMSLQNDGDHQSHKIEIDLPALEAGYYTVILGTQKDFKWQNEAVVYASFGVSNISYNERRNHEDESYDFKVLHRETGVPLKGVKAQIYYREYNYTTRRYHIQKAESYISDENGLVHVKSIGKDYRYMYVDFTMENDRLNSDQSYYQYRPYKNSEKRTTTHFFTDRAIYRPGQTIHFKGIHLTTDHEGNNPTLVTRQPLVVTLYDYNYQRAAQLDVTTNEYGSFSGTFTAPVGLLNGQMHITSGYGTKYISVEEYKRPKFEVDFNPVKGVYRLGDPVQVTGTAKAYAGSNIDGAKVSYRVSRNLYFPYYWCSWYYYQRGRSSQSSMEVAVGETKTDENGEFKIDFTAIADGSVDKKYMPGFSYTVSVDITDINGETHSSTTTLNAGYTAMMLSTNMPSDIFTSHKSKIAISATNLNYNPVNTQGKINIYKLKQPETVFVTRRLEQPDRHTLSKEEYYKTYPGELYADELTIAKWPMEKKVFEMDFDTRKKDSLHLKDLKSWTPGEYMIETTAKDSFGMEVKDIKYFSLVNEESKTMSFYEPFKTTLIKGTCEPGETAKILISTKWKDVKVYYEIEERGKIVSAQWLSLSDEQRIIEIPVLEKHRGNFGVHFSFVKNNRSYTQSYVINVPFTNKEIEIEFETFRNKILPGSNEEWKMKVKGKKGEQLAAEMLVTMYDASLDAFAANYFYFFPYQYFYANRYWGGNYGFSSRGGNMYSIDWNPYYYAANRYYDQLNWFGYQLYYYGGHYYRNNRGYDYDGDDYGGEMDMLESANVALPAEESESRRETSKKADTKSVSGTYAVSASDANGATTITEKNNESPGFLGGVKGKDKEGKESGGLDNVKARTNLSETAFFFPQLETNEKGEFVVKFTAPEALTRWKILGVGHTKDLKVGTVTKELVTQKDLMVMPNAPRFFREGDKIIFSSKISNVSDKDLEGNAQLFLLDPVTLKPLDDLFANKNAIRPFAAKKGLSTLVSWEITIPEGVGTVSYRIVAKAGSFSDGEEMAIPVLTNRMMVTESLPLPIRKAGTKTYTFTKLINSKSSTTLRNHKLTLEYTSNPSWYAIQALPYMMEYPYECAEQTFTRFYANSIASHIVNSSPKIKAVFTSWQNSSPDAFLSNLEKNQELKSLMLEETPWVLEAKNESERKKRVALLFDLNRMSNELNAALRKLKKTQVSNGGWPWFPGMPESRYITQHIITGMGHLDKMGIKNVREESSTWNMVRDGVRYLDARTVEDYEYIKRHYKDYKKEKHIHYDVIQFMYARSYFRDIEMSARLKEAMSYYGDQAKTYWLDFNLYAQGMLALAANRFDMKPLAQDIVKSVREKAIKHEELGMYWKDNVVGYYWYQAPIETHAMMIEMFDEVANDQESVADLKVWLLKNKQTSDWKTTKATAEACFALLLRGTDVLANDEMVEIKLGDEIIDPKKLDVKTEAGTGYFKTSWSGGDIKPEMGKVTLTKKTDGVAWGALYWQYFENLDKITPHETPIRLSKKLFLVINTETGPKMTPVDENSRLNPGDRVRVRVEIHVDRAMEYVHMKDMRASCFEPVNVFSRYKYQDGLGYYESTKDAATNFFFEYLPKGSHVFEYDVLVSHLGEFSNGITTIQCMYAPEFTSHSEGIRVKVTGK